MTTTIRPVRASELVACGRLVLAAYDRASRMSADYRAELADTAGRTDSSTTALVAVGEDGHLLGTITVVTADSAHFEHPGQGDGGFRALAVLPSAQGRGVGTALVEHVLAHGRRRGWRRLAITTMAWMSAAQRLYERLGFERRPDLDVRYPAGVGHGYTRDLTADASTAFPPPGPVPARAPWYDDRDGRDG